MSYDDFEEDPMEMIGMVLPGEPGQLEAMAECLVEEYVRLGWDARRLLTLFVNPMFMATHRIYQQKGEAYVHELIDRTCAKWVRCVSPRMQSPHTNFTRACHSEEPRCGDEESPTLIGIVATESGDSSSLRGSE